MFSYHSTCGLSGLPSAVGVGIIQSTESPNKTKAGARSNLPLLFALSWDILSHLPCGIHTIGSPGSPTCRWQPMAVLGFQQL